MIQLGDKISFIDPDPGSSYTSGVVVAMYWSLRFGWEYTIEIDERINLCVNVWGEALGRYIESGDMKVEPA